MAKIIGIDLGTTNSCVAIMEGNTTRVIENSGVRAPRRRSSPTRKTARCWWVPRPSARRSPTQEHAVRGEAPDRPQVHRGSAEGHRPDALHHRRPPTTATPGSKCAAKLAPPRSAPVLRKMKKTAEDYLGEPVTEAVITVPAYFNDSQRQATKDAGASPASTSSASSTSRPPPRSPSAWTRTEGDRKIAVYDPAAARSTSRSSRSPTSTAKQFEVLSTNGDTFLGGEDFDQRIIDYSSPSSRRTRASTSARTCWRCSAGRKRPRRPRSSCPTQPRPTSTCRSSPPTRPGPKHLNIKLTRAKLEALVEDLIERTIAPCRTAIKDAGCRPATSTT